MYTFHREQIYLEENKTRESWYWGQTNFKRLNPLFKYDYNSSYWSLIWSQITGRIGKLAWVLFTFACISMINALFIRVSIKCSVLIVFPMLALQNRFTRRRIGPAHQRLIYQQMGDVGALSAYLDRNRMSKSQLFLAFISTLIIYYLMYMACYQMWTFMAFSNSFAGSLNDAYFFYMNTIELLSFLFVRTRSSIKYFPKMVTLCNLMFLMYVNSYMYPCQFEALNLLQNSSFWLMALFLNRFEYEAINSWNPFGTWTPSESNPRCAYHHVILGS